MQGKKNNKYRNMKYDLKNENDLRDFNYKIEYLKQNKKIVELKAVKMTRTALQNKALHKYFEFIATELNELGLEYQYTGLTGRAFAIRYTPNIVKDFIWRPIQIALFDLRSTTALDTKQMNEIIDIITKFFGDQGIVLPFPCLETLENIEK